MICDYCTQEFEINQKGSGGKNRLFCFTCLPEGLDRANRNTTRSGLYALRKREHKEGIGCNRCGYNKYGGALEWHHPNDDKLGNATDFTIRSWRAYLDEIAKCELLCSCCHKEEHAGV